MSRRGTRSARTLAWALGLSGAAMCAATLILTAALGLYSPQALDLLIFVLTGLLGALVASRAPKNSVGWVMCAASLAAVLVFLPMDYGYIALIGHHASWPLGSLALWLGTWTWAPVLGLFFPFVAVRFPDGKVPPGWQAVDWLAIAGTATWAASLMLAPADVLRAFLPLSQDRPALLLASMVQNPLGIALPAGLLAWLRGAALALIVLGYVTAVASLIARFRHARDDERLQLKWFAYAGTLIAAALVYGGVAYATLHQGLGDDLLPFGFASFSLPLAIGIAILRYHLYDIDLIINRTLVYGTLTAIVAAAYTAGIILVRVEFMSASGLRSDAAIVLTTFAVVIAFNPIKDGLQRQVDRRVGGATASAALDQFTAAVDAVVSVLDVQRVAHRLVDQAVAAFDAQGGALYLQSSGAEPVYSRGRLDGHAAIEVAVQHQGQRFGRLILAGRRGDTTYSDRDRDALQKSADSVGEALALAAHLRHRPPNTRRREAL